MRLITLFMHSSLSTEFQVQDQAQALQLAEIIVAKFRLVNSSSPDVAAVITELVPKLGVETSWPS